MSSYYETLAQVEFVALLVAVLYILHSRAETADWEQRNGIRDKEFTSLLKAVRTYEKRETAHEQELQSKVREIEHLGTRLKKEVRRGNGLSDMCGRTYDERMVSLRMRRTLKEMREEVHREREQVERERTEACKILRRAELMAAARPSCASRSTMTDFDEAKLDRRREVEMENDILRTQLAGWTREAYRLHEKLSQEERSHQHAIKNLKHPYENLMNKRFKEIAVLRENAAGLQQTIDKLRLQLSQKDATAPAAIAEHIDGETEQLKKTSENLVASVNQLLDRRVQLSAKVVRWELQCRVLFTVFKHMMKFAGGNKYRVPPKEHLTTPPSTWVRHYTGLFDHIFSDASVSQPREELETSLRIMEDGLLRHTQVASEKLPKLNSIEGFVGMMLCDNGMLVLVG